MVDAKRRRAVILKVRALMNKTVANGATEAEALAAAEKARAIMDEYNLTLDETQLKDERITKRGKRSAGKEQDWAANCLMDAVADFTDTYAWIDHVAWVKKDRWGRKKKVNEERVYNIFCGTFADVQFAHWLLDTMVTYCVRGGEEYIDGDPSPWAQIFKFTRENSRKSFIQGSALRIAKRLKDEAAKRRMVLSNSKALVLAKHQMLAEWVDENGPDLEGEENQRPGTDWEAFIAGKVFGDKAQFDVPLEGDAKKERLGYE